VKLLKKVSLKRKNKMIDQLLSVVYMIGVLLLILPAFLQSNSKIKQFLTNLTIWIIIVLMILTIIYIFKKNTD
jgi:VIT1/CCC1 family predicted Fe2+/Mn2+ transporter